MTQAKEVKEEKKKKRMTKCKDRLQIQMISYSKTKQMTKKMKKIMIMT
jgi:hypothetical protein